MKITVLDGAMANPGDLSWDEVAQLGELRVFPDTIYDEAAIIDRIGDAEAIFTNKVPISAHTLDVCPSVRFIGVLATGYNVIDVAAATAHGVTVCNIPAYATDGVAQHAFALLLESVNHVGHHADAVRGGAWNACGTWCFWDRPLTTLAGKTFGVFGLGKTGMATARIAKAFGMRVIACSRTETDEGRALCEYVSLDGLLAQSDVLSLHAPLTEKTRHLICAETIAKMKDGAILINTARGPLVDEAALCEALRSGKLAAAGLDVTETEPPRVDSPLYSLENCYITPHVAWASFESRKELMRITAQNLRMFQKGTPVNVVNA